ncbi:MAG: UDP-2,4-diacetamido-2,4,6-trideoxy-beta-L-altropyranose hydrolase [Hyphomicrobiaceae bacterium]
MGDPRPLRIAVRADASARIGGGHVMRCLTLAHMLGTRGAEVLWLCNAETVATVPRLATPGRLIAEASDYPTIAGAIARTWDGAADGLIIDHYGIDRRLEEQLRAVASTLMVVDDLADRPHDCDLLLDQTFGREADDYEGLVPDGCRILTGAGFALLRPEFAAAREAALARRSAGRDVGRVLISLGLGDVAEVTAMALRAALAATPDDVAIDVVVGRGAIGSPDIAAMARSHARIALHCDVTDMSRLMSAADLAVGAAGSTSWERCCLGLPSVLVVLADNQRLVARQLAAAGAAIAIETPAADALGAALAALCASRGLRTAMATAAAAIVPGDGAARVAEVLLSLLQSRIDAAASVCG